VWLRAFITLYSAVLILSTWVVSFLLQAAYTLGALLCGVQRARRLYVSGLIFRSVSALVTAANPFWRFTRLGSLPAHRPHKLVVMSNHVSNLDPFITCRALLPWESKYIAKSGLFSVPFGGWCMSLAGDM
jgi:1-acyl-sn-glycerol-3-phosphate acyltransferase